MWDVCVVTECCTWAFEDFRMIYVGCMLGLMCGSFGLMSAFLLGLC